MNLKKEWINLSPKARKCIFLLAFLAIGLSVSHANSFNLYSNETDNQTQGFSNSASETEDVTPLTNEDNFGFYEDEVLKAPPGGGAPIGGVPVGEGSWILLALAGSYICLRNFKSVKFIHTKK